MDRREFLKTCAALGVAVAVPVAVVVRSVAVKLGRPSALVADNLGLTMVGSQGRIYFVPGDADTIAEAIELVDAAEDRWRQWKWSSGHASTDAGAIRDLEQWGE